jgi:hypothetical protein
LSVVRSPFSTKIADRVTDAAKRGTGETAKKAAGIGGPVFVLLVRLIVKISLLKVNCNAWSVFCQRRFALSPFRRISSNDPESPAERRHIQPAS